MNNIGLMRSLTKEQLEMCYHDDLVQHILSLRSELNEKYVKILPLEQFIKDRCIVTDCIPQVNGNFMAPTSFDDIFFEFKQWCQELGHRCNDSYKKKTKGDLLKWQEETSFGLSVGQNRKEGKPNGTLSRPYFNLVVISED
tara:strand:+ start:115 stop:537 length:423 start_codon:yes stop_codon:yes gene_type:complete